MSFFILNSISFASFPVYEKVKKVETSILDNYEYNNLAATAAVDTNLWGILSLVCGVLGIFILPFGIPALIFGIMGLKKPGKGMAIAGLILGSVEVLILLLYILLVGALLASAV